MLWKKWQQTFETHTLFQEVNDQSAELDAYLRIEQPYDCAGSAKCEGLGISLLARIGSDDPTSLIGLPLILTTRLLRQAGLDVLAAHRHVAPTHA